ncbi:MAG: hypothetical protein AB8G99_17180 [Planctomycetaceae bacterium]
MRTDDEQNLFQQITGSFDEPAFLRRAKDTEAAWQVLLARTERKRVDWLKMPTIYLGRVFMLASGSHPLSRFVCEHSVATLHRQFTDLNPALRRKISAASTDGEVRSELKKLIQSFERFNTRWQAYVEDIDFGEVNMLRAGYNKYYTLEKECALMSSRTATAGFQELPMVGPKDIHCHFPPLSIPRCID